jgi:hypothetical protein
MSIDNHNASSRRGGGDQTRDQKSMLDSSTNMNSHGSMRMADFSFSPVLHKLADGFEESDVENDADAE